MAGGSSSDIVDVSRFLGSWSLVDWFLTEDGGEPFRPLGPKANGMLIYAPDGYMYAALMRAERQRFAGNDPFGGTPEECTAAMHGFHTYCGRYRFEGDKVIHTVTMSLFPNLIGSEQHRHFKFEKGLLILSTPPLARNGKTGLNQLTWRRVADRDH